MRLTVLVGLAGQQILQLEVAGSATAADVAAAVVAELRADPGSRVSVRRDGAELPAQAALEAAGVADDSVLQAVDADQPDGVPRRATLETVPEHVWANPAQLQQYFLARPHLVESVRARDPDFAAALSRPGPQVLAALLRDRQQAAARRRREEEQRLRALETADPFDVEAQRAIEERIRLERVQENMEAAVEHNPESFGSVFMLYVRAEVNHKPVMAFVDCGAQMTIMSKACAERCGIMRLVDTRFAGVARGVGQDRIIGRVHAAEVKLGERTRFLCSFTILENQRMDFLLGLDNLRRYQAMIDLKKNCLTIGGEDIPYANEADIARYEHAAGPEDGDGAPAPQAGPQPHPQPQQQPQQQLQQQPQQPPPQSRSPQPVPPARSAPLPSSPAAPPAGSPARAPAPAPSSSSSPGRAASANPQAPAQAPGPAPAPAFSLGAAAAAFPRASIEQLMSLGCTQAQAIEALVVSGGDLERAAAYLFN